ARERVSNISIAHNFGLQSLDSQAGIVPAREKREDGRECPSPRAKPIGSLVGPARDVIVATPGRQVGRVGHVAKATIEGVTTDAQVAQGIAFTLVNHLVGEPVHLVARTVMHSVRMVAQRRVRHGLLQVVVYFRPGL
ncbi:MAG: hypothetical protein V1897_18200, partial [Pseudomonadota bacterium]